jgi:hypothetical protein
MSLMQDNDTTAMIGEKEATHDAAASNEGSPPWTYS